MLARDEYALSYAPPRFRSKVKIDAGGCWLWTGSRDRKGYGRWSIKHGNVNASRFAYEHFVGQIPEGLTIDHLCRNTSCVNPAHMEPVTRAENLRRGEKNASSRNRGKTHCPKGHEYTPENTYTYAGKRWCRRCVLDRQATYRQRKRDGSLT